MQKALIVKFLNKNGENPDYEFVISFHNSFQEVVSSPQTGLLNLDFLVICTNI